MESSPFKNTEPHTPETIPDEAALLRQDIERRKQILAEAVAQLEELKKDIAAEKAAKREVTQTKLEQLAKKTLKVALLTAVSSTAPDYQAKTKHQEAPSHHRAAKKPEPVDTIHEHGGKPVLLMSEQFKQIESTRTETQTPEMADQAAPIHIDTAEQPVLPKKEAAAVQVRTKESEHTNELAGLEKVMNVEFFKQHMDQPGEQMLYLDWIRDNLKGEQVAPYMLLLDKIRSFLYIIDKTGTPSPKSRSVILGSTIGDGTELSQTPAGKFPLYRDGASYLIDLPNDDSYYMHDLLSTNLPEQLKELEESKKNPLAARKSDGCVRLYRVSNGEYAYELEGKVYTITDSSGTTKEVRKYPAIGIAPEEHAKDKVRIIDEKTHLPIDIPEKAFEILKHNRIMEIKSLIK